MPKLSAAAVERDRVRYDEDDRQRCVCVHESIVTSLTGVGPSVQCLNRTRHPSGKCGDCRVSMRTVDGGAIV